MNIEAVKELTEECIQKLEEAKKILNKNLREIKTGTAELQKKHTLLETWQSEHLKLNRALVIDLENIVSSQFLEDIQTKINILAEFPGKYHHYKNLIEKEYDEQADLMRSQMDKLS